MVPIKPVADRPAATEVEAEDHMVEADTVAVEYQPAVVAAMAVGVAQLVEEEAVAAAEGIRFQKLSRAADCTLRESPTAVGCPKLAAGTKG